VKPVCEACGAPDQASKAQMMAHGMRELPDIIGFRPTIKCGPCREIELEFIRALRQESAEGTIERERVAAGEPPLTAEALSRAARRRWQAVPPVVEALAN
jgi:hypothetical protein